jgi:hypothetical protein
MPKPLQARSDRLGARYAFAAHTQAFSAETIATAATVLRRSKLRSTENVESVFGPGVAAGALHLPFLARPLPYVHS